MPELAVIRLAVYDNTDKQLGMRILPFNDMQVELNFKKQFQSMERTSDSIMLHLFASDVFQCQGLHV